MKVQRSTMLLMVLVLGACYEPSQEVSLDDRYAVASTSDNSFDYQTIDTYSLADSIVIVDDGEIQEGEGKYDPIIIAQVRENLLDLNLVEEQDPENNPADVVILIYAVRMDGHFPGGTFCFWPSWDWYDWYDGWAFGPGYCWFNSFPIVINTFDSGTLFIRMIIPSQADVTKEEVPTIWLGSINAALRSSQQNTESRLIEGINQVFSQSPYLTQQ